MGNCLSLAVTWKLQKKPTFGGTTLFDS
jgi:hypothetical protein